MNGIVNRTAKIGLRIFINVRIYSNLLQLVMFKTKWDRSSVRSTVKPIEQNCFFLRNMLCK